MADLNITTADVKNGPNGSTSSGTAGATITAGDAVYLDSDDDKLYPAEAGDTAKKADVVGVALHGAEEDQPLEYVTGGDYYAGATLTVGETYVVTPTEYAGNIAPIGDLSSGDYVFIIGVAETTTKMYMIMDGPGVQKAA